MGASDPQEKNSTENTLNETNNQNSKEQLNSEASTELVSYEEERNAKLLKDNNSVQRGLFYFYKEKYAELQKQYQDFSVSNLFKVIFYRWQSLPIHEKLVNIIFCLSSFFREFINI